MNRFRRRIAGGVINLSARLARGHRRVTTADLERSDPGRGPSFGFNERLRDFFRRRWLRIRK